LHILKFKQTTTTPMDSQYAHESPLATPQRNNFLLDLIYGGGAQEDAGVCLNQRMGNSRVL